MDINGISNNLEFKEIANKIQKESNTDFEKILNNAVESQDEEKLKKVCDDFEAIFVNMLLKSMKNTVSEGGLTKKSHAREMFEGMLDEEMASSISKGRGIGIAEIIYDSLSSKEKGSQLDFKG